MNEEGAIWTVASLAFFLLMEWSAYFICLIGRYHILFLPGSISDFIPST